MVFPVRLSFLLICLSVLFAPALQAQFVAATQPVQFSQPGGFFASPTSVELSCTTPGAEIRYTLDGSEPNAQSALYLNLPFNFDSVSVLRTRAYAPGMSPSPVTTHSYLIGAVHYFPVVSLVFAPAAFFDPLTGIYTNYDQDLTAVSNIEFFETNADTAVVNQLVEIEIQGTGSAGQPQKSLEIKAKNALGAEDVQHRIFPDLPYQEYKRFVLRNGGQDWCVTQFRDEFATSLMFNRSDIGDILREPALHMQAWRPAVVYLNGAYWGIHNVRERMNRFYVRQHFDWDQDEFDMIENYGDVSSGDSVAWFQLFNYLWETTDGFEADSIFENLKQKIDYQNFIDYCAFNIFIDNEDWPGNNVLRFRHRSPDGKWQWMTYDLDFTFGLFQQDGGWNTGNPAPNALARLLDGTSLTWPNPDWATLLFRRCWQNAAFRRDFANRLADMLNTAFLPQRVCARLDEFANLYQPEIGMHYERWWFGNYQALWLQNIEKIRYFAQNRTSYAHQEILQAMSDEASGLAKLTLDVFPPGGGRVEVSTVRPSAGQFPWAGVYFKGVPVPLKAVASPGYKFAGWSKPALGTADSVDLVLHDSSLLVAHFQLADSASTGVYEDLPLTFNIYPNPAKEAVTICGDLLLQDAVQLQVLNGLGQVMLSEQTSGTLKSGCTVLEMSHLPSGFYFLKVSAGAGKSGVRSFVIGNE